MISKVTNNYSPSFKSIYQIKVPKNAFKDKYPSLVSKEFEAHLTKLSGNKPEYDFNNMKMKMKYVTHIETPEHNFTKASLDDNSHTFAVLTGKDKDSYLLARHKRCYENSNCPATDTTTENATGNNYINNKVRHVFAEKDIKKHEINNLNELKDLNLNFEK